MFLVRPGVLHFARNTRLFSSKPLADLSEGERLNYLRKMALPKSRENPVIFKLDSPDFHSLFTDELKTLASMFKRYGYEIRIAGGAVRDLLSGLRPTDLDFATTATPVQMKEMFTAENVRMINMNGEKHGTITPRINDKENFEVTTLRIDVVTDGRRAEVQFTTDWLLDALRRDLTINSMFLDFEGAVYDYFYGYEDLKVHKVQFVGDAATRIKEDYLRILRYFRFYGRIAKEADKHEEGTLNAIRENKEGLGNISGERIWMELRKILEGNFAGDLLIKIIDCGLSSYIGLPERPNVEELKKVWQNCGHLKLHPITLLCATLRNQDDAVALNSRLKLSVFERDLALFITEHRAPKPHVKPLMPYQQLVLKINNKNVFQYVVEVLKYINSPHLEEFQNWTIPKFPVTGNMLKEVGVESGRKMGLVLTELRNYWADQEYKISAEDLLKQVPNILNVLSEKKRNKQ
ncbi:CCA tRNA nucleotidyltransferase 1, mitochondrial-like Protein [Tribolium castaneum]|uniref:CCA tRNA nucleotidyltransferase 1, mitochondrial-like Protein n=1 Tax=Tribolium castaneum TaxID=7070 RepID=D6WPQ0_TRICA|nr:PREDICTED: CCA tRNA nucleotidyltransferase 1, mitochondrial [Tribolium castaneum]EFA06191.2 CCA tRNA nucleotidyltransferase 1, mitochondrial-like Protein [Tribolium castaneum]|eukprot:XP_008195589.2 PREDICTED: CCA tRNA nucleotidyltransferase 1, mitochondrial [Tribolium castaneum]